MKLKITVDSGANIKSSREIVVDLMDDFCADSPEDAKEQFEGMSNEEQFNYVLDHIMWKGFSLDWEIYDE